MNSLQVDEEEYITLGEIVPKKHRGPANKRKGSRVEREYANIFKELNELLSQCKTTRNTSRVLDACKVDLNFLPILVQIKAGEQKGLNPSVVLQEMVSELKKHLPANYPEHTMPKVLIHHKDMPKGRRKRVPTDSMVSMTFDDFLIFFLAFLKTKQDDSQNRR